jgi:uncharacterized membrane protein (UPF0127 family)
MAVLCRLSYSSVQAFMIEAAFMSRPAILLLVATLAVACGGDPERSSSGLPTGTAVIDTAGGEVRVEVEIAETVAARTKGLMGRESLPDGAGMVFLADEPSASGFWMKGTLIPLSVAFWGPDNRISEIVDMEPCRKEPCTIYGQGVTWVGALEVNQGFFDQEGVAVGDVVRLER